MEFGVDVPSVYFGEQQHASLVDFFKAHTSSESFKLGALTFVMTYDSVHHHVAEVLSSPTCLVREVKLHHMASEKAIEMALNTTFAVEQNNMAQVGQVGQVSKVLVVTADLSHASYARILHAKHLLERLTNCNDKYVGSTRVVMLVHAERPQFSKAGHADVDYDCRWMHVFVDAIEQQVSSQVMSFAKL